jgi:hypothetical protein
MYSEEDEEDDEDLLAPAGMARPRAAWVDDSDLEDPHHHYASTNQDEVLGAFRSAVERHDNAPLPPPLHSLPPRSQSGRHLRAASSSPPPYSPRFTPSSYPSSSAAHSTTHRDGVLDEDGESFSSASLLLPAVHETTNHNSSSSNNRRQQAAGVGMSSLLADLEHEAMHWRQAHDTERQRHLEAEAKLAEETHHRQLLPAILAALRTARNRETTRVAVPSSFSSSGVRDPIRAGTAESFVFLETLNRLVEALEVHVLEDHTASRTTPDRRPYHEGRMTSTASSLDSAVPLQTTLTTPQSALPTAEKGGVSLARQFRRQRMLSRNTTTAANNSTAALERPEAAYLVSCLASRAANRTSAARSFYFQSILRQQDTTLLQRYFRRWSQWRSRLFEVRHCGWRRDPRRGKLAAALLLEKMAHRFLFHSFAKWQWFAKMRQFQRHMTQAANLLGAQTTVLARHIRNQALLADEAASQCAMIVEQQTDCLTELLATLPRPTLLMNHGTGASSTLLLRSTGR